VTSRHPQGFEPGILGLPATLSDGSTTDLGRLQRNGVLVLIFLRHFG